MQRWVYLFDPTDWRMRRLPVITGGAHGTADEVAADWAQKMGGATDKIKRGAQAVKVSPGQQAAAQKGAYTAGVAANADKWARNVGRVTLTDWVNAVVTKGADRVATGASAAEPKMAAFLGKLLPYVDNGRGQLPARGGPGANKARMTAWFDYMSKFSK